MEIRPIHILAGWFWLNFTFLCWYFLLGLAGGVVPAVIVFVFAAIALTTSMSAYEAAKGGRLENRHK